MATCTPLDLSKGLTAEICQAQLALWLECSAGLAVNQSWEVEGVKYTRADLGAVLKAIDLWDARLSHVTGRAGPRSKVIRRVC
jgi:hypothetical protein